MKFICENDSNKNVYVQFNKTKYQLNSDEIFNIDLACADLLIQVNTDEYAKVNFLNMVFLFIKSVILSFFNIIIMNYPTKWDDNLDPFTVFAKYKSETDVIKIKYSPAKISQKPIRIIRPKLIINDKEVNTKIEVDTNAIKYQFFKYSFTLVSVWIYGLIGILLVFLFSGKMAELFIVFSIIIIGITVPIVIKIFRTMKKMKEIIIIANNEILNYEKN